MNNGFFKMFFGAFLFGETLLHKMQPGTQCHWDALEHLKKFIILKLEKLWTNLNFGKTWTLDNSELWTNLNFGQTWTLDKLELWRKINFEKTQTLDKLDLWKNLKLFEKLSINKSVAQWTSLSHWQVTNKETPIKT